MTDRLTAETVRGLREKAEAGPADAWDMDESGGTIVLGLTEEQYEAAAAFGTHGAQLAREWDSMDTALKRIRVCAGGCKCAGIEGARCVQCLADEFAPSGGGESGE